MPKQKQNQSHAAGKAWRYLRSRGLKEFASHAVEKVRDDRFDYQKWIRAQEPSSAQTGYQKKLLMHRMPQVVVMILRPETNGGPDPQTMQSVRNQTYQKTCTADVLTTQIDNDTYVLCVRNKDLLTKDAVFRMVEALQGGADAVYADEDSYVQTDRQNHYSDPLFKPDYSPDYLRSCNYIGTPFMVRAGLIRSFYTEDEGEGTGQTSMRQAASSWMLSDPAAYYEYVLRCSRRAAEENGIVHVPRVLCHVSAIQKAQPSSDAADSDERFGKMRQVLEADLLRCGEKGTVEKGPLPDTFHITYELPKEPLVSIVIPNKDNYSVLENCIWSICNRSTYTNYEILIVENNSTQEETFDFYRKLEEDGRARVIRYEHPFHFSRVVNEGVRHAEGEYVILMNNDVTVRTPDWIERLLGHCMRDGVGTAGPKLLYPDGRVQSCGVVAGIMGYAGSMMVLEDGEAPGYMGRAVLTQNMSALTAACVMVSREVFLQQEGFADDLPIALNDVDFGLRLVRAGYRNVLDPSAVLIHHESLSRGAEDTPEKKRRFEREKAVFRKKWAALLRDGDPAYNPNLSRRKCDWSQQT